MDTEMKKKFGLIFWLVAAIAGIILTVFNHISANQDKTNDTSYSYTVTEEISSDDSLHSTGKPTVVD